MTDSKQKIIYNAKRKNYKADAFEKYLNQEGINFFRRTDAHDAYDTVVFMTGLPAGGDHQVVCAVITDNSMYTQIRIHLGTAPTGKGRAALLDFLQKLNARATFGKYIIDTEKNVFLDICIISRPTTVDPYTIRFSLDLAVQLLKEGYGALIPYLEKTSDQSDGFEL